MRAALYAVALSAIAATAAAFIPAPRFTVDLDTAPAQRWTGAVQLVVETFGWAHSFGPVFADATTSMYSKMTPAEKAALTTQVATTFPVQFQELHGIAKDFAAVGHPEVDVAYLCFWVWWHELSHADDWGTSALGQLRHRDCTGVLTLPADVTQPVVHSRNLDGSIASGRNMTLQVSFVKGGVLQYEAVDYYWFTTGFVTGVKKGCITAEENWRFSTGARSLTKADVFGRITGQGVRMPQVFMFRQALEGTYNAPLAQPGRCSFDDTVSFLARATFAAPFYAIVSGTGRRGAVLTIAFNATDNVVELLGAGDARNNGTYERDWFLVQTNYDRWLPDPANDARRTAAEKALVSLGRADGATVLGGYMVVDTFPVHNTETFYTVIMDVVVGARRALIRRAMVPAGLP